MPVFLLILPTVLSGAFMFMGSLETDDGVDKYPWADTLGAVATAITGCLMFYFPMAAAAAMASTLTRKEEMAALEYDKEVQAADAAEKTKRCQRPCSSMEQCALYLQIVLNFLRVIND